MMNFMILLIWFIFFFLHMKFFQMMEILFIFWAILITMSYVRFYLHVVLMLLSLEIFTLVLILMGVVILPFWGHNLTFMFIFLGVAVSEAVLGLSLLVSFTRLSRNELLMFTCI